MIDQARSTTILAVRRGDQVALAGDGQVTVGETVVKHKAVKVRRLAEGTVLAGFAGAAADAFTLFERFEAKLKEYSGNLLRAAVELAKDWRTDKVLRNLNAFLIVADRESTLLVSGDGNVLEPDEGTVAIGSGGPYALAAAKALQRHTDLDAPSLAREALNIAQEICIYTNSEIVVETL